MRFRLECIVLYTKTWQTRIGQVKNVTKQESDKSSGLLTAGKEMVTAALGITIILATLVLMWPSLSKSPVDTQSASGIFAILGGWGGVVLGYYFGRLPAEKATDKASEAADSARKEKDAAEKTKTLALANSINQLNNTEQFLKAKRDKLKDLAQQPAAAQLKGLGPTVSNLESIINEIESEIAKIGAERQKVQADMAK